MPARARPSIAAGSAPGERALLRDLPMLAPGAHGPIDRGAPVSPPQSPIDRARAIGSGPAPGVPFHGWAPDTVLTTSRPQPASVSSSGRPVERSEMPAARRAATRFAPGGPGDEPVASAGSAATAFSNRSAPDDGGDARTPVQLAGTLVIDGRAIGRIAAAQQTRALSAAPMSGRALDLRATPLALGRPVPTP